MDVAHFLDKIRNRSDYSGQLSHVEVLPAREGSYQQPAEPLHPELERLLRQKGIDQLYSHQVEALEAARRGEDLVVVSGTASGKTLCYHLPILEQALQDTQARALYLFPTKALAQDQHKGLLELLSASPELAERIVSGIFDGDTPTSQRRRIRAEAQMVLSNPDMLHASILPYHPKWGNFFSELKFIVLDEVHMYRGILGAHVACVLRRLLRICHHYGSHPVFLAASATIANPGELASRLIGREVAVIDNDGAPRGRKYFALWNPSPDDSDRLARRGANDEAADLLVEAVMDDAQVIAFTRTRQAAELIHRYAKEQLQAKHSRHARDVRAYRGGYLPNERREIEQSLFAGRLRAVAATNALELGIDVGSLDVALLAGFPGTIASTWQQAGRAGRRQDESLAILIAGNDPVDQYLLRNPGYFFQQSPEHAVVDPENPYVLAKHLKSAAFELPLSDEDVGRFGPLATTIAEVLYDEGELNEVEQQYYFAGGQNPAVGVSLRHMSDNSFSIVLKEPGTAKHKVIANVDSISAPELVYPEAVYLHNSETYLVRQLDLEGKVAYIERAETDYYTQAVLESNVKIERQRDSSDALAQAALYYGDADVSWKTVAFKKIKFETRENIGLGPVDIPEQHLATTAAWLVPSDTVRAEMKQAGYRTSEGIVGLRNLAIVALPIVAMCDSRDISGVVDSQNLGRPTMILYDRYPGGLGYSEKGFHHMADLLLICHDMIVQCPCDSGCPSCVGLPNLRPAIHSDPDLTRGWPIPNKQATIQLLELLCTDVPVCQTAAG